MDKPIFSFTSEYDDKSPVRMHMPGHKGKNILGIEGRDITEIDGADCLYNNDGIIKESQKIAGNIFHANTFYSVEGSSLSIRAMVYLATNFALSQNKKPFILAGRNAHKSFISAVALCDCDVEWLYGDDNNILSCNITCDTLDYKLRSMTTLPTAIWLTTPDYLGNVIDLSDICKLCKAYNILLLIDNAHGSYMNFLDENTHPISLGATMCCDSAHKTLPALTGCGYLHINREAPSFFKENAESALSLFASTSPSYVLMESLDILNTYMTEKIECDLYNVVEMIDNLKNDLTDYGYTLTGNEKLKVTINTKKFGYFGYEINEILKKNNIYSEFYDQDYIVFMMSSLTSEKDIEVLKTALLSIEKKEEIKLCPPELTKPIKAMSIRKAVFSPRELIDIDHAENRVSALVSASCPPAVPLTVSGEIINSSHIKLMKYYNIHKVWVVKN